MDLKEKFIAYNQQLLDPNLKIETKTDILAQIQEYIRGSPENISLAVKCGIFFGLVVLAKNVKTDEDTLNDILTVLGNLTAGSTEDYNILMNEGCQNLIMEFLDKTLSDSICELAIWNVANLAVESAEATKIMVKMGCLDRVIEIYLAKANSELYSLTATTAWCIACFLLHESLDEEHYLKIISVLKQLVLKENDKETLSYIKFTIIDLILNGSRKVAEEMENQHIFKELQEGFSKHKQHSLQDPYLHFYLQTFGALLDDTSSRDITLKYITQEDTLDNVFRYYFEVGLRDDLLPNLMTISGEPIQASPYLKILLNLIIRGNKEVREALVHVEHNHDVGYFRAIIRTIPTRAVDHDTLSKYLKSFNEIIEIAKSHKEDENVIKRVKAALLEHKELVKKFLDSQHDEELQEDIKKLYEQLGIETEAIEKNHPAQKEGRKVAVEINPELRENLPLKDEDMPRTLQKKFKRMSTMAQTAFAAKEFLQSAGMNLRKTRNQTKLANEPEETKESKAHPKKAAKKSTGKGEKKIRRAIPEHPAIRRTKTIEETLAAAKAFLKSSKKGLSARKSLRSATKVAKKLRRTKTMSDTIESSKGLTRHYGKGKRARPDVDYSQLFFKRVKKQ
eukprot:CAMPEP_0176472988 /NCGR_PEP_ID=MMETSP0127-20121128/42052_1 /TAXON_ID=938130 /ORGANISM="Platyophrya macrostoma, Strain WH" /LENGTH=620 /DNA_ID=CAMNT_0017867925 /DNA_START=27 /DNA_END=1889 /DNA_ORIENTATION=-